MPKADSQHSLCERNVVFQKASREDYYKATLMLCDLKIQELDIYYALNVCVPPNSYVDTRIPNMKAFRDGAFGK